MTRENSEVSRNEQQKSLFESWRIKQNEEVNEWMVNREGYVGEYFNENTILSKINPADSFTPDGIIDENEWNRGEKILFILKEANAESFIRGKFKNKKRINECDYQSIKVDDEKFWFRERVNAGLEDAQKDRIGRKLKAIGEKLSNNADFSLKSIAYMNLNKRGGISRAKAYIVESYLKEYSEEIIREIRIINPKKIVVCCGRYRFVYELKKMLKDCLKDSEIDIDKDVSFYFHPSSRKKMQEYMEGIRIDV